jgi:hypothetical protein
MLFAAIISSTTTSNGTSAGAMIIGTGMVEMLMAMVQW